MSDVPYGAFLSGGVDCAGDRRRDEAALRHAADHVHDRLPRPRRGARRARARGRDRAHHRHRPPRHGHARDGLPRRAGALHAAARGALRDPERARAAAAVALRGQRREGGARGPGSRRAARRLRPPPGRGGARRRSSWCRPPPRRPRPRSPARCPARRAARRVAHLLGGRGDAERLLRLVEITRRATSAPALLGGASGDGGRGRAPRSRARDARRRGGRGLLEQALYLDTHMFLPDGILLCNDKMSMAAGLELRVPFLDLELMRFVERIPAAERVGPRRRKRLHSRAMARLLPPEVANRRKHGFATPYDDWLRASLGQEVERRYAPGSALVGADRPGRRRAAGGRAPPRPCRPQGDPATACSSSRSGTRRSSRRGSRWRREPEAGPLRPQPQGELRRDRPRHPGRALRGRGPLPARPLAEPGRR